ncbi:VRK [Lepeophtheirus salmonis]|uniref:non-specific serine/threonine protein kinase n=1 Tax=Lepeophtheirus salmonis TaxID=72036 RepID=A0A817F8V8_LEPSM|nr:VRK [Lepeophtheirus salmonis]CAG9475065.1 VRK [Lepeophtheirus salmonis]
MSEEGREERRTRGPVDPRPVMPPKASKRKATNGYRLPDPIPKGEIFADGKTRWRIGKSIGVGGFGEIYLCSNETENEVKDNATHVMKVEPSENGPLFVEMHFYVRAATPNNMDAYKKEHGIKDIGIPCFRGKGLHTYKGQSYRFLIIDRYGKDLQKIFQTGRKIFAPKAAYNFSKFMDALEYIHSQGYVHNDLKAQNLLLGHGRTKENDDVFLVDFGLVSKYKVNGVHLEYKPDARRAHDGTIEYTSRDAHIGAHSRRSDLEILGYNLVHWMSGNLPWMSNLTNPVYVHTQKKGFMSDIPSFLRNCFGDNTDYPDVLEQFLNYTDELRSLFAEHEKVNSNKKKSDALDKVLVRDTGVQTSPAFVKAAKAAAKAKKRPKARKPIDSYSTDEEDDGMESFVNKAKKAAKKALADDSSNGNKKSRSRKLELHNQRKAGKSVTVHPSPTASPPLVDTPDSIFSTSAIHSTRSTAPSSSSCIDGGEWCWERVLCSDPEMLIRQASRNSEAEDESPLALQRKTRKREHEREQLNWQQQLQHLTGKKSNSKHANQWMDLTPNPLTPAMEDVINMRAKRVSIEVDVPITPEPSDDDFDFDDLDTDSDSSHEEYRPPKSKKKRNYSSARSNIPSVSVQNLMSGPNKIRNKSSLKPKYTRRISVQNDAELIYNKTPSNPHPKLPAPTPTSSKKSRKLPTRSSHRLRCKSSEDDLKSLIIDGEIFKSSHAKKKAPSSSNKKNDPSISKHQEKIKLVENGIATNESPQVKWEKILRINPERLLKKKNLTARID